MSLSTVRREPVVGDCLRVSCSYHAVQGGMDELGVDVREAGELALVDVGDDQLVGRRQHRLGACEKLVEVFCTFATLKQRELL